MFKQLQKCEIQRKKWLNQQLLRRAQLHLKCHPGNSSLWRESWGINQKWGGGNVGSHLSIFLSAISPLQPVPHKQHFNRIFLFCFEMFEMFSKSSEGEKKLLKMDSSPVSKKVETFPFTKKPSPYPTSPLPGGPFTPKEGHGSKTQVAAS